MDEQKPNTEAQRYEWRLLGCLYLDPRLIPGTTIWPDQISDCRGRAFLEAMQRLSAQEVQIDMDSIDEELKRCGHDSLAILRRFNTALDSANMGQFRFYLQKVVGGASW